jgi:serine/threonine protein phosphatase 1
VSAPSLVRRVSRNTTGRDIIVGDVHGSFTALRQTLDSIKFDDSAGDRLFMVGDLVDRGPESIEALWWLAQPWVFAVAGNHEDMAIRWPTGHMEVGTYAANGGGWMIALDRETQLEVAAALSALPVAIELETADGLVCIVHADVPFSSWRQVTAALENPALSNRERGALVDYLQWSRDRINSGRIETVEGVRAVVVGHTPLSKGPVTLGNVIHIDTMGWRGGHFTLLDAATLLPVKSSRSSAV